MSTEAFRGGGRRIAPAKGDAVPLSLPPLAGGIWMPAWAVRPGAFDAVAHVAACMPLWSAMHSLNADYMRPAYATREAYALTIGASVRTVTRQLAALKKAALMFEVDQGVDRVTRRHRPRARWALDPLRADHWREKLETRLAELAETTGQDARWFRRAVTSLEAFERRARILANRIEADMPVRTPRKRKKRKKPRANLAHKGLLGREGGRLLNTSVVEDGTNSRTISPHDSTRDRSQLVASNAHAGTRAPNWPVEIDRGIA